MIYRDTAIVLRTYKLGEADRIVVLLTLGRGKVRAVAKGVRKTMSKFGGRLEPTSHVVLQLYEGRDLHTITQAETVDAFRLVREDLDRLSKASALLEVVDQVAQEHDAAPSLYRMLLGALRALEAHDSPALVSTFYLKLLAHEGHEPVLDQCVSCGSDEPPAAFDITEGGVLCRTCRRGLPISAGTLDLMRRTLGGELASVLREPPSPLIHELDQLASRAVEQHLERRLRSTRALG